MHAVVDGRWKLASAYGVAHDGLESSGNNMILVSDTSASRAAEAADTQDRSVDMDKMDTKDKPVRDTDKSVRARRTGNVEEHPAGDAFESEVSVLCVCARLHMPRAQTHKDSGDHDSPMCVCV